MKKLTALLLIFALIATLAACGAKTDGNGENPTEKSADNPTENSAENQSAENLTAGYEELPYENFAGSFLINGEVTPAKMPDDVQTAFDKAVEGYDGMSFTPVAYLGSQVVAGANYAVLCVAKPAVQNSKNELKVVVVYKDLKGGASVLRVNNLYLETFTHIEDKAGASVEPGLAGGWTLNTEFSAPEFDEGTKTVCDAVFNGKICKNYEPIACLGTQVVSGLNIAFLCKTTSSANEQNPASLKIVTIYADLDGKYELAGDVTLDVAAVASEQ